MVDWAITVLPDTIHRQAANKMQAHIRQWWLIQCLPKIAQEVHTLPDKDGQLPTFHELMSRINNNMPKAIPKKADHDRWQIMRGGSSPEHYPSRST